MGADIPDRERAWAGPRRWGGRGVFTELSSLLCTRVAGFLRSGPEKGAKKPASASLFMSLRATGEGSVGKSGAMEGFEHQETGLRCT